jgi:parallel beta-helix repeat protein
MVRFTVYIGFAVLLLFTTVLVAFTYLSVAAESVIRVPYDYINIQEAINAANAGDTIRVSAGVYYEHVVVNKSISLIGENSSSTIIDGNGTANVLLVVADNVLVTGFKIMNGDVGIWVNGSNCTIVSNNIMANGGYLHGDGIYLDHSLDTKVYNNTITDNGGSMDGDLAWGSGINCHYSMYSTVEYNSISSNIAGGILLMANYSVVKQNNVTDTGPGGITVSEGWYDNIADNMAIGNTNTGINLVYSSHNVVKNNTCTRNGYVDLLGTLHGGGISVGWSSANIIEDNSLFDNVDWGIDLSDLNPDNIIRCNTIFNNPTGLHFHYSNGTTVYHNNFINNSKNADVGDAYPDVESWDNSAEGNYWSNFTGEDTNLDGIIDTPYVLDIRNQDNYPLAEPWSETRTHEINWDETIYNVTTCCNSTVAGFSFSQPNKQVGFNITSPANSTATCNVTIPLSLMWGHFSVLIDNIPQPYAIYQNQTHTSIYFVASFQSTHQIKILSTEVIPENPLLTIVLITVMLGTAFIFNRVKRAYKRKLY